MQQTQKEYVFAVPIQHKIQYVQLPPSTTRDQGLETPPTAADEQTKQAPSPSSVESGNSPLHTIEHLKQISPSAVKAVLEEKSTELSRMGLKESMPLAVVR